MSQQIYLVNPHDVEISPVYPRDVRKQMERLKTEGQIEPILVSRPPRMIPSRDNWVYSHEQVAAARELGWPTILVTY
jgi:ParB-like chromosome segregation protein Spo0J